MQEGRPYNTGEETQLLGYPPLSYYHLYLAIVLTMFLDLISLSRRVNSPRLSPVFRSWSSWRDKTGVISQSRTS
ncbi:hypothetical protein BJX62DRAFT_206650 [Aspergillus germanicus]